MSRPEKEKRRAAKVSRNTKVEMVRQAVFYLSNLMTRNECALALRKLFIAARSNRTLVNDVIKKARAAINKYGDPRIYGVERHRRDALAFYRAVIRNNKSTLAQRMFAMGQIVHITGAAAPIKFAETNPDGSTKESELTPAQLFAAISKNPDAAMKLADLVDTLIPGAPLFIEPESVETVPEKPNGKLSANGKNSHSSSPQANVETDDEDDDNPPESMEEPSDDDSI